jgi:uncharacterized protein YbjT (DUF2867 family)
MLVTVSGGTGFLGHHIVEALARESTTVRVAVRHPDGAVILAVRTERSSHRSPRITLSGGRTIAG